MHDAQPALPLRDHTILGICEALGEDFGVNPIWFRLPLAVLLLWNPGVIVAAYLGLGVIVLVSRLIAPEPRKAAAAAEPAPTETEAESLKLAA